MAADPAFQHALQLQNNGRLFEAVEVYRRILRTDSRHLGAVQMLAMLAAKGRQFEQAAMLYRRALLIDGGNPELRNNLGMCLRELDRLDEATAELQQAIRAWPAFAQSYRNYAIVQSDQGRSDLAVDALRQAVALDPDSSEVHSSLLYMLHFHGGFDGAGLFYEHRQWALHHARPLYNPTLTFTNSRDPDRRLRIGYVSADFCKHIVGRMIRPLLAHHDHARFAVICYASVRAQDSVTAGLKPMADEWHDCLNLSDDQLASQVRQDRIDILVDLSLHTGGNRLLTFARKPAPVQVTWLGYPGTTGLDTIDYRFTDPHLDPPGIGDEHYSEKSFRLPHTFWCYQPIAGAVDELAPAPEIRNGCVTFGCLNRFAKVTRETLLLWRQILIATPGSRFILHSKPGSHLASIRAFFRAGGVTDDRVEFIGRLSSLEYLKQYRSIDICLDPIPHGGGATTGDALWMGVPVITLAGRTAVGRGGASILINAGLPHLIAKSEAEYAKLAMDLARDLPQRLQLRHTLRKKMQDSPLLDGARFAADIESAYRKMWRGWCSDDSPTCIHSIP